MHFYKLFRTLFDIKSEYLANVLKVLEQMRLQFRQLMLLFRVTYSECDSEAGFQLSILKYWTDFTYDRKYAVMFKMFYNTL